MAKVHVVTKPEKAKKIERGPVKSVGRKEADARLKGFLSVLSEELSNAKPHTERGAFAVARQKERAAKKALISNKALREVALQNFIEVNNRVANVVVDLEPGILVAAREFISHAFERYTNKVSDVDGLPYDPRLLQDLWRFGPGASNGIRGTHTAEKIEQPMSCTLLAVPFVVNLRGNDTYFRAFDLAHKVPVPLVNGSRMTTVPKNESTDRTIAIEPSGNMALQLALGSYIEGVLRGIGLDIRTQADKNKALAQLGSLDGSYATLDLSNASDMFSFDICKALLPAPVYDTMLRLRSPVTHVDGVGEVHLNMMSTMGNGFTFPMMTLIFASLVYAVRFESGGPKRFVDWTRSAVFGDDIIVRTGDYTRLCQVLASCGFIVNLDKSFSSGPFRESCGGDYYDGGEVTPFYVKDLSTDPQIYIALNKVIAWCAREELLLWRTLAYLKELLVGEFRFVPEWLGDDAGYRTALVTHKYTYYKVSQLRVKASDGPFTMRLACGGYICGDGPDAFFTPRPFKTRYKVGRGRIPRGYASGRDPLTRSDRVSAYVESYDFLFRVS